MEENYKGIRIKISDRYNFFDVYLDKKYLFNKNRRVFGLNNEKFGPDYVCVETLDDAKWLIDSYIKAIKLIGISVFHVNSGKLIKISKLFIQGRNIVYLTKNDKLIANRVYNRQTVLKNKNENKKLMIKYNKIISKINKLNKEKSDTENKFKTVFNVSYGKISNGLTGSEENERIIGNMCGFEELK